MNQRYSPETLKFFDVIIISCLFAIPVFIIVIHTGIFDTPEQQYERMIFRKTLKMSEIRDRQQSNDRWKEIQTHVKTSCSYNDFIAQKCQKV